MIMGCSTCCLLLRCLVGDVVNALGCSMLMCGADVGRGCRSVSRFFENGVVRAQEGGGWVCIVTSLARCSGWLGGYRVPVRKSSALAVCAAAPRMSGPAMAAPRALTAFTVCGAYQHQPVLPCAVLSRGRTLLQGGGCAPVLVYTPQPSLDPSACDGIIMRECFFWVGRLCSRGRGVQDVWL